MYYRRKTILALLQVFDGQLEKIRLQKLLFLFTVRQSKADYDFIPYKFGCFSYSANADMIAMVKRGFLIEDDNQLEKTDKTNYLSQLNSADQQIVQDIKSDYGRMSVNSLIRHTYLNYPFYAIKSEVAESVLTKDEQVKVLQAKPRNNKIVLYTIGYEGISLEEYLVRLLKNDIKVLVDVRNNPLSMKYGFSKNQLKKFCEGVGIQYTHFPEVGIQSDQRKELNSQDDYDMLFKAYRKNNLTKTSNTQIEILKLLKQNKRIALTCFEANICQCHRKPLADAIKGLSSFEYEVKHI